MESKKVMNKGAMPVPQTAGARYLVDGLNNEWGNILVLAATAIGAFLGFDNSQAICAYLGVKHSVFAGLACAGAGAAAANVLVQFLYYVFSKLMNPFVPDHWLPTEG